MPDTSFQPAAAGEAMFPIMGGPKVPWSLISPYEAQAQKNHYQSLKRLAERGGLSICEAMAVMTSVPYDKRPIAKPTVEDWMDFIAERKARAERRPSSTLPASGVECGIYIASKTTHGARWRTLRASGEPIISTWIDESGVGETSDWPDLWSRCVNEAKSAGALIVYREDGETLKGAWVEVGAALAAGRPVFAVGCSGFSVHHHPLLQLCGSLDAALEGARAALTAPAQETSHV